MNLFSELNTYRGFSFFSKRGEVTCFYFYISDSGGSIKPAANLFDELPEVLQGINFLHNSSLETTILLVYLVISSFDSPTRYVILLDQRFHRKKGAVASCELSIITEF